MRNGLKLLLPSMVLLSAIVTANGAAAGEVPAAGGTGVSEAANASSAANVLGKIRGLDFADRSAQYDAMVFDPSGWQVGMVVSKEPYAVVTGADPSSGIVKLRVWTGVLTRDGSDLLTYWDELWLDRTGKVTNAITDADATIDNYFAAPSQEDYRTRMYLGKAPWADIPTDAEAAERGIAKVPDKTTFNVYGIVFKEADVVVAEPSNEIRKGVDIPDRIPAFAKRKETTDVTLPKDMRDHWAWEFTADLMKKGIVEGYEDNTIRPDLNLTRGEFVALLCRAIGLNSGDGEVEGYTDVKGHWSETYIAAAQKAGVLSSHPVSLQFQPDAKLTRIDMAEMVANVLSAFQVTVPAAELTFNDTQSLSAHQIQSLRAVVGAGIIGGYPDGSFKPKGLLTRAEAFKVVSVLINS